jgi:hypothetical protein
VKEKKMKKEIRPLNHQYELIRKDVLKLREDLADGYDLLKQFVGKRMRQNALAKRGEVPRQPTKS